MEASNEDRTTSRPLIDARRSSTQSLSCHELMHFGTTRSTLKKCLSPALNQYRRTYTRWLRLCPPKRLTAFFLRFLRGKTHLQATPRSQGPSENGVNPSIHNGN